MCDCAKKALAEEEDVRRIVREEIVAALMASANRGTYGR